MRKQISLLRELQQAELRIKGLKWDQEQYPIKARELHEKLTSEKEAALREKERFQTLEMERRRKEGELNEEGERIKRSKGRLFEVKTNKEYQALLHEIDMMQDSTSRREDEILAILEETDQLQNSISQRERTLVDTEKDIRSKIAEIETRITQVAEEIKGTERRRKAIIRALDGDLLTAYETLKTRRGTALAAVKEGACQGCYVNIPPQMYNEVRRNESLIRCPNCNRFLYWENDEAPKSANQNGK